jgi:hypothetical protein
MRVGWFAAFCINHASVVLDSLHVFTCLQFFMHVKGMHMRAKKATYNTRPIAGSRPTSDLEVAELCKESVAVLALSQSAKTRVRCSHMVFAESCRMDAKTEGAGCQLRLQWRGVICMNWIYIQLGFATSSTCIHFFTLCAYCTGSHFQDIFPCRRGKYFMYISRRNDIFGLSCWDECQKRVG